MNEIEKTIEISNLTVKFGDFTAVDDVSFSVNKGEIFGFLGANGAGKTTTIRVMCGLLIPNIGDVKIAGHGFSDGGTDIKKKVGYMSQKFTLYDDLTVIENLQFKASLRKIEEKALKIRIKELFEFIGFNYPENMMVRDLPSGIKQQVSLCATLLHDPEIIFLDEPTSGVSPEVRKKFWALIDKLSKEGKTVIVTSHYLNEAEECQRIALMRTGKLIALDSPEMLKVKTYPEGLVEIYCKNTGAECLDKIYKDQSIEKIWPFGHKYHAVFKNKQLIEKYLENVPEGFSAKRIQPSLEDVFMKLVEEK
ncbi:MAG: ABC transporter ATP-binding protein [Elusimicrobia bacterium]|nr:ABC transporter ATP-binding protein [Elusimicrobiota bacterium]